MSIVEQAGFETTEEWLEAGEMYRAINAGTAGAEQRAVFADRHAARWSRWQTLREAEMRAIERRSAGAGAPADPAQQTEASMLEAMRRARVPVHQKRPAGTPLVSVRGFGLVPEKDIQPYRSSDDRAGTERGIDRIAKALGRG